MGDYPAYRYVYQTPQGIWAAQTQLGVKGSTPYCFSPRSKHPAIAAWAADVFNTMTFAAYGQVRCVVLASQNWALCLWLF